MADENDHGLVKSEQEGSVIMINANHRETDMRSSWKPRFLHNVAAKVTALALWKVIVVVVALALDTGLAAKAVNILRHHGPASTGVVLGKLVALGDFEAAKRVYSFNFPYVVHKSILFFTGETIQVIGSGSDDAVVDFSTLTKGSMVRTAQSSLTLLLSSPTLGLVLWDILIWR